MAYNEHLADRIRQILNDEHVVFTEKKMMGGLCILVDGKMLVGVNQADLMARIGPDAYESALKKPGCREMDFTGRPMRGFVFVDLDAIETKPKLRHWLKLALAFNPLASLPNGERRSSLKPLRPGDSLSG